MAGVNFGKIEGVVNNCCLECESKCNGKNCLVGYPKIIIEYFNEKHEKDFKDGISKIPNSDIKVYEETALVDGIAETLIQCRECGTNHRKDCVIGIIRASLERALIGDNLDDFKGNAFSHIIQLSQSNSRIGNALLDKYKEKKELEG